MVRWSSRSTQKCNVLFIEHNIITLMHYQLCLPYEHCHCIATSTARYSPITNHIYIFNDTLVLRRYTNSLWLSMTHYSSNSTYVRDTALGAQPLASLVYKPPSGSPPFAPQCCYCNPLLYSHTLAILLIYYLITLALSPSTTTIKHTCSRWQPLMLLPDIPFDHKQFVLYIIPYLLLFDL